MASPPKAKTKEELLSIDLPIPIRFDKIHEKLDADQRASRSKHSSPLAPQLGKDDGVLKSVSAHVLNNATCRRLVKAADTEDKAQKLYPAERDVHGLALYGGYKIKNDSVDFNYCTLKLDGDSWQGASAPKLYKSRRPLGKEVREDPKPSEGANLMMLQPEADYSDKVDRMELSTPYSQYSSMRSTVERIPSSTSVSPHCTPNNVGPGTYNISDITGFGTGQQSSMFRSSSLRFPGHRSETSGLGYASIAQDRKAWKSKGTKFEESKRQLVSSEKKRIPGPGSHLITRWPNVDPNLYKSDEQVSGHAGFYSRSAKDVFGKGGVQKNPSSLRTAAISLRSE